MMKYLYRIYQLFIALPILLVLTLCTALITIICCAWKNSWWLHRVQMAWAKCVCYLLLLPVTIEGAEHIRPGQSYVFVSNHQSMLDIFIIYGWLPVIFKWLMKQELRKIPFVGTACVAAGHIFINRAHAREAQESIQKVEAELVNGISTVIFPEGTRSIDGNVGKFKRGAFQIALDLNLPIIPISLSGCDKVMKKGELFVSRYPMHMHIGEEMDLRQFNTPQEAIDAVREIVIRNKK